MRKKTHVLSLLLACATAFGQSSYDLVIVGGNPGGIMAAISAARMGKKSVILERTRYVGGLPANGLGATDIATRAATTGLFREFVDGVKQHYIDTYGPGSEQVKVCRATTSNPPSEHASSRKCSTGRRIRSRS